MTQEPQRASASGPRAPSDVNRIGRYQIRHELGRGMMGIVYLAHDPDLGRDIALKLIQLPPGADAVERASYEQRFFAEARSAARLSHQGIVVVHDVGRDTLTGAPFMALQFVPGETLDRVLMQRTRLDPKEALRIGIAVTEALHHAHTHGVVHRDVKPANIMVLPGGEPRVMDFGIAKLESSRLTATGQFLGTPLYMSPEQAMVHPVDGRSDVFSLGSVLYEMLTGAPAFFGESVTKILIHLMQKEPAAPSTLVAALPGAIDHVLKRCLAKDVRERYQTGQQLADDLRDILEDRELRSLARAGVLPGALVETAPSMTKGPWGAATFPGAEARLNDGTVAPAAATPPNLEGSLAARVSLGLLALAILFWFAWSYTLRTTLPAVPGFLTAANPAPTPFPVPILPPSPASVSVVPATLVVDFEHSLKSGLLRIFIDDEAVTRQTIGAKVTRRIIGIPLRKERVRETIEVSPGRHTVRIEVTWDGNVRTEAAQAAFRAGGRVELKVRFGSIAGLRKNLSLEWK